VGQRPEPVECRKTCVRRRPLGETGATTVAVGHIDREKIAIATNRTSFDKMQRDRAKKARAAMKREKRQGNVVEPAEPTEDLPRAVDPEGELSPTELLRRVEDLHRRFESKKISFEEFEDEKAELMRRLPVD
jgi:hypothetical protein